jgi:hypothetical protein
VEVGSSEDHGEQNELKDCQSSKLGMEMERLVF